MDGNSKVGEGEKQAAEIDNSRESVWWSLISWVTFKCYASSTTALFWGVIH